MSNPLLRRNLEETMYLLVLSLSMEMFLFPCRNLGILERKTLSLGCLYLSNDPEAN